MRPSRIKIIRGNIGCRHQNTSPAKQLGEQAPEDHRIGDISDRKLVEAEQFRFGIKRCATGRNRIRLLGFTRLQLLPMCMDASMHIGHKFMKVAATLLGARRLGEEHVHEHGLAPSTEP